MRKVTLTTGYEIDLEDEEGLEHLFNAIIGEVTTRLEDTEEFSEKGFCIIFDVCICELHFVAGQLHHMGSGIDIKKLLDEFRVQWNRVAEKLNSDKTDDDNSTVGADSYKSKDCIKQVLCDRRMQRGTDCEYWILDGKNEPGEVINGIGSLIILYDADGRFCAQGIISKEYSLSCTEDDLLQFLEKTLDKFGIDLGSGGTLQFMCSDYYIDVGF